MFQCAAKLAHGGLWAALSSGASLRDSSFAFPFVSLLVSAQKRCLKTPVVLLLVNCTYSLINYMELEEQHSPCNRAGWQERRQWWHEHVHLTPRGLAAGVHIAFLPGTET